MEGTYKDHPVQLPKYFFSPSWRTIPKAGRAMANPHPAHSLPATRGRIHRGVKAVVFYSPEEANRAFLLLQLPGHGRRLTARCQRLSSHLQIPPHYRTCNYSPNYIYTKKKETVKIWVTIHCAIWVNGTYAKQYMHQDCINPHFIWIPSRHSVYNRVVYFPVFLWSWRVWKRHFHFID